DDDDGLCQDFTALLRREAQHAWDNNLDSTEAVFLSFADGVSLVFRDTGPPHLAARHVPFTNLGLAMVARPGSLRHPLATSHLRIGARHHARVITSHRPTYIRSVHDHNDSRAQHSDARLEDPAFESSLAAFPFLTDLLRPKGAQTPLAPHASPA
ncbi:MAG: glycosyltransferase, partial [Mangrovicoccus sp.]